MITTQPFYHGSILLIITFSLVEYYLLTYDTFCSVEQLAIHTCGFNIKPVYLKQFNFKMNLMACFSVVQASPAIFTAFGRDTQGAQWTTSFLLDKIISNIALWTSELGLLEDTLQLLVSLVDQRPK